jgi:hypothetical protein
MRAIKDRELLEAPSKLSFRHATHAVIPCDLIAAKLRGFHLKHHGLSASSPFTLGLSSMQRKESTRHFCYLDISAIFA